MEVRAIGWFLLPLATALMSGCGSDDAEGVIEVFPADLIILAVEAPTTANPGQVLQVTVTIRNIGEEATPANAPLSIVISTDNVADVGDRNLLEGLAPPLGAGATVQVNLDVTIPTDLQPGTSYFLGAIVDPGNLVSEAAETNNSRVDHEGLQLTGTLDLLGSSFFGPAAACPGQSFDVNVAVDNASTVEVRDVQVGVYLSLDPQVTADDVLLASYAPALIGAGGIDARTVQVTIPLSTAPGGWFLGLIADVDDRFAEADETNNVAFDAGGVQINADPTEPNDTLATSSPLGGPGPQVLVVDRYLCPAGDVDFYAIEQQDGLAISADLTGLTRDLDLTLYDVNGTVLATSATPGTAPEFVVFIANYTGTYHVRVQGATGTEADPANPYTLTITLD